MNKKDLERGYTDTGYIPEEGDNLGQIEKMVRDELQMERQELKIAKMFGTAPEYETGGFLERQNTDDRY